MEGNSHYRRLQEDRLSKLSENTEYGFYGGMAQRTGKTMVVLVDDNENAFASIIKKDDKTLQILLHNKDSIVFKQHYEKATHAKATSALLKHANELLDAQTENASIIALCENPYAQRIIEEAQQKIKADKLEC